MKRLLLLSLVLISYFAASSQSLTWKCIKPDKRILAETGTYHILNTENYQSILYLPDDPSVGDMIGFMDYSGTFHQNSLTVDAGLNTIDGKSETSTYRIANTSVTLIFSDEPRGWTTLNSNLPSGERNQQIIYPEDFGAVGNGVDDDYLALVAFFNFITGSDLEGQFMPNKTYLISSEITHFIDGDFVFNGNGSTLARNFSELNGKGSTDVIEFRQSALFTKYLSLPFSIGDSLLKVDNSTDIEPGMGFVTSNGYWTDINGEIDKNLISKVSDVKPDNWIEMEHPSPADFATVYLPEKGDTSPTDDTQTTVDFYGNYNIEIRNLTIAAIGDSADMTDSPAEYHLLRTTLMWNAVIENCTAQNGGRSSFAFQQTYGTTISGFSNNYFTKNIYGMFLNDVVHTLFKDCDIKAFSPAISTSASCCYGLIFENTKAFSHNSYSFDSHGAFQGRLVGCELYGVGLSAGDWSFDNCQFKDNLVPPAYFTGTTGSAQNSEIRLNVLVENSDFYSSSNDRFFLTKEDGQFEDQNTYVFNDNRFRTEDILFYARRNNVFENNMYLIDGKDPYVMPNSTEETMDSTENSYYSNFSNAIMIDYDIGGLSALSGIAKIKTDGGITDETIFGANVGQNFFVKILSNQKLRVYWRESSDDSYQTFTSNVGLYAPDTGWRTIGFTLKNISGSTGECRLYIDGKLAHVEENILFTSLYSGSYVGLRLGAAASGSTLDGAMESALFFEKALTPDEVSHYSVDLSRGRGSEATLVLLEEKTRSFWYDESGNGYNGTVGAGIDLNKLSNDSGLSYYHNFLSGKITTSYDLNGISGLSALIKAKFDDASNQCLLGEGSGNIFYFRCRDNNSIELKFKNSAGGNPIVVFEDVMEWDNLWHTYGFTLDINTAKLYIDGVLVQTKTTIFSAMQAHPRLLNIGQRGSADGVNGSIASVLIFDEELTSEEIGIYTENPSVSMSNSSLAFLDNKSTSVWFDDSGNGHDGNIGPGIILYNLPSENDLSYYSNFTNGKITTSYDLNGIAGLSVLVKAKFNNVSNQCLLGEASGNVFYFRCRDNNYIEIKFKNSDGDNPMVMFENVFEMDTLWHTFGFTLDNNTVKLYIDGLLIQTKTTTFSAMQAYPRLLNIGQRGSGDGVNGSIASVLIFEEELTSEEIELYTENPESGVTSASAAFLDDKSTSVWLEDTSNGHSGNVGPGITLNSQPTLNELSYYSDFMNGKITTSYDLNGITGLSALVKAKFDDASNQCLLGEGSGNIFYFRCRNNNNIELKFKNSQGDNPVVTFEGVLGLDSLWHTYGFTLDNNTAKLYIDGIHIQTKPTTFSTMQAYPRLLNIGQRGSADGVNGSIATVLIFEKELTSEEVEIYTENPSVGVSNSVMAFLEDKSASVWLDDSSNGHSGNIGPGIILNATTIPPPPASNSLNFYSNFLNGKITTSYDFNGITGLSALVKAKLDDVSNHCLLGEASGNIFYLRCRNNNNIELKFKNSAGSNPVIIFEDAFVMDSSWHTYGFTLDNNTVKLYIDGLLIQTKTTAFSAMQAYPRLLNIGQRGSADGVNGSIASVLIFEEQLTGQEMASFTENPASAVASASAAFLEDKSATVWLDDSSNGHSGNIGPGITLNSMQPVVNSLSYYSNFTNGKITTSYDLNGITGISALVKAKFNDVSTQCLLGEASGNIFYLRYRDNNYIELKFKNAAGDNPVVMFENAMVMDTLWHTYGFTLDNNTAKLYIDGVLVQTKTTTFSSMQAYPRLLNIGQRGSADGVNGSIASVLIFEDQLTGQQMASYTENPASGIASASAVFLEEKSDSVWQDESGNGNNGNIGDDIILIN